MIAKFETKKELGHTDRVFLTTAEVDLLLKVAAARAIVEAKERKS